MLLPCAGEVPSGRDIGPKREGLQIARGQLIVVLLVA